MGNYLFPKLRGAMRTNTGRCLSYTEAYRTWERLKTEFGLMKDVSWHCPQIGGATRGAQMGAVIK